MNSVSVGAAPRGEAVIFQRWNWKSCKSISWLRLDGHFWITGLLLSKCGAGRQSQWSSLLEPISRLTGWDQHEQHYGWIYVILLRYLYTLCLVAQVRLSPFHSGQKMNRGIVERFSFLHKNGKSDIDHKISLNLTCMPNLDSLNRTLFKKEHIFVFLFPDFIQIDFSVIIIIFLQMFESCFLLCFSVIVQAWKHNEHVQGMRSTLQFNCIIYFLKTLIGLTEMRHIFPLWGLIKVCILF